MTERLYYGDAYVCAFRGTIVDVTDEGRRVYLDRSAFYPTSGGQPADRGTISGVAVTDVIDEEARVAHVLEAPLAPGAVEGVVDWSRRFDHMQQHTGQHLLSAVFADRFGYETASVHFGPDYATLDLAHDAIPLDHLVAAEARANEVVAANRAVTVSFEDAATVTSLRKASDRLGVLRIVTIDGIDRSACGGTHVRATGEIGPILVRRAERMRRQTRVEFVCGARAVRRARMDYSILASLASAASASIDELGTLVPAQAEQLRTVEAARRKLEDELAGHRARARWDSTAPDAEGVRWIVERRATSGADEVRAFALAMANQPRAVYVAVLDASRALLIASSEDSGVDAGRSVKAALTAVGGKGGGSPRLAQGSAPDLDALQRAVAATGFPIEAP